MSTEAPRLTFYVEVYQSPTSRFGAPGSGYWFVRVTPTGGAPRVSDFPIGAHSAANLIALGAHRLPDGGGT